jgi:hypothetical protein
MMPIAHPKVKVTSIYFSPKPTNPERLYGVKIMKIQAWQSHTWAPLKYACYDIPIATQSAAPTICPILLYLGLDLTGPR